jgi:hypothetical protein
MNDTQDHVEEQLSASKLAKLAGKEDLKRLLLLNVP